MGPVTMRMSPELAQWLSEYAVQFPLNPDSTDEPPIPLDRSALIRELLEALKQRRLVILPEPVSYVPNVGDNIFDPVLVCLNPKSKE